MVSVSASSTALYRCAVLSEMWHEILRTDSRAVYGSSAGSLIGAYLLTRQVRPANRTPAACGLAVPRLARHQSLLLYTRSSLFC